MEHTSIKNGATVKYTLGNQKVGYGIVKSYNPGGPGIFTVYPVGQRSPYYLLIEEIELVVDSDTVRHHRIKKAEQIILEAACENPLRTNGPYLLADNNAAKFMRALHLALLELTADEQEGTI